MDALLRGIFLLEVALLFASILRSPLSECSDIRWVFFGWLGGAATLRLMQIKVV